MRLTFCAACGTWQADQLEHHHLTPRSQGGSDDDSNIVTLCHRCHGLAHGMVGRNWLDLQRAGIAKAKAEGVFKGRKPSFTRAQLATVHDMLGQGAGVSSIAKATGLSRQAVYRIEADPMSAESMLAD